MPRSKPPKPPKPTTEDFRRVLDTVDQAIAEHGHAVISVMREPERDMPEFSYSVGLAELGLPELLVLGLRAQWAQPILNDLAAQLKRDASLPIGEPLPNLLGNGLNMVVHELASEQAQALAKVAVLRNNGPVTVLQAFWPDAAGKFPWEDGFDERFRPLQALPDTH